MRFVDIVFDKLPGPRGGEFIEVENPEGASIGFGEWVTAYERNRTYPALRIRLEDAERITGTDEQLGD